MLRTSLALAGLLCLGTPVLAPTSAQALPASSTAVAASTDSTTSGGETSHPRGADIIERNGLWRCLRHPRECLGDDHPQEPGPITGARG